MAASHLIELTSLLVGLWWLLRNTWIFPSRHYHGEDRGCGRITMLPSKWNLPFGIDKLAKTLKAERKRNLPVLSLEDHERYGDTYGQYAAGLFTVITRDSRNISSLLSKPQKFGHGNLRKVCFATLLGDGIFTKDGAEWRSSRRLLTSVLHNQRSSALSTIESHFQNLLQRLLSQDASAEINMRPLLHDFTLDTATDLFLGKSTGILRLPPDANNEGTRFSKAFNEAVKWLAIRERFKFFAPFITTPSMMRACSTARDSLKNLIIEAQNLKKGSGNAEWTGPAGRTTDLGKARDELMNLLFAARDSNASLLCWLVYALAREPAVLGRLRQEVLSCVGNNTDIPPNEVDLANMRYLDDVVHETLRLFPAVPINGRLCRETTTLPFGGGDSGEEPILVPRGALVGFSTYACHRSSTYYGKDAMEFRPERWQEISVKTRSNDFTFHPFIGGPRKCLGEHFALTLAKYTICRLLQYCSTITADASGLKIVSGNSDWQKQVRYQIGLTMCPDDGVLVKLG